MTDQAVEGVAGDGGNSGRHRRQVVRLHRVQIDERKDGKDAGQDDSNPHGAPLAQNRDEANDREYPERHAGDQGVERMDESAPLVGIQALAHGTEVESEQRLTGQPARRRARRLDVVGMMSLEHGCNQRDGKQHGGCAQTFA